MTHTTQTWKIGDCKDLMRELEPSSVDLIVTDPPYGYSFMGKDWDRVVPPTEIWQEALRVLKPGAFAFIMSAPRQDVLAHNLVNLSDAGFETGFTSIYWTYANGFPKAGNIGKMVDKRAGAEREVIGKSNRHGGGINNVYGAGMGDGNIPNSTTPATLEAKALDGSYSGFQPKPAVEVIMVVMKPLSESTYVDQALTNGKGVTWLDEGRIPYQNRDDVWDKGERTGLAKDKFFTRGEQTTYLKQPNDQGRFPANLLVSDDVLNDDSGSFSRYFDMDAWWTERIKRLPVEAQKTFPFLVTPKASKSERCGSTHPTIKPVKLFSWLMTIGSRHGDTVLDPFLGSGTALTAGRLTDRTIIGFEIDGACEGTYVDRSGNHTPPLSTYL